MKKKYVIKASGKQEEFDIKKFKQSIKRCGGSKKLAEELAQQLLSKKDIITTKQLYQFAKKQLCKINRPIAARYNLKQALFEFGPSGFPFERFVAEVYKKQGYLTDIGKVLQGWCIHHETDVIAKKDSSYYLIECKFHTHQGIKSPVQTPLYVKARFEDILKKQAAQKSKIKQFEYAVIITNTRFTKDAQRYGICAGIQLIDWSHPKRNNLPKQIEKTKTYPITTLTTLQQKHKKELLKNNIILCNQLYKYKELLHKIGLSQKKIKAVLAEAAGVCTITIKK